MENKEIRISVDEFLDIIGYGLGQEYSDKMKRHWRKYGNWNRLKDAVTKDLIYQRKEDREKIKRLQNKLSQMETSLQEEFSFPRSTKSAQTEQGANTDN